MNALLGFKRNLLVDHESTDCYDLPEKFPLANERILLVEESHKFRAVMAAVALRGEDELPCLEFRELLAFEKDLECLPDERGCSERAVHFIVTKRKACADRLVDVEH